MSEEASPRQRTRVLLADANPMRSQLICDALRRRSEFSVALCKLNSDELLGPIRAGAVDVVLINADGGSEFGRRDLAIIHHIHLSHPEAHMILLVDSYDRQSTLDAFRSGVQGIFTFSESKFRDLCKCIHVVREGQVWANSVQLRYLLDLVKRVPSLRVVGAKGNDLLTPREQQVVALVADGMSNRQVAVELGLREHTVKTYLFRIFEKLGISSRVELVLYAMNDGNRCTAEWMPGA